MPQWKVRTRPQQGAIEVCAPGADARAHLLVIQTTLTPYKVIRVDSVSQDMREDVTAKRHRTAVWNGGDMHTLGHAGPPKAARLEIHSNVHPRDSRSGNCSSTRSEMC